MRALRTALGMLLLAVGGAVALVVTAAAPATACSCATGDQADYFEWGDTVFTGEVVASDRDGADVTYRFDVDRVYDGEAPEEVALTAALDSATCGLPDLEVGTAYVVYATADDAGRLSTGLCSGTREARAAYVERLQQYAGSGHPPGAATQQHPGTSAATAAPADLSGDAGRPATLGLVGGGAAVAIAAALLIGRRRAR